VSEVTGVALNFAFAVPVDQRVLQAHPFFSAVLGLGISFERFSHFPNLSKLQILNRTNPDHVFACRERTVGETLSDWTFQRLELLPPTFRALMPLIKEPSCLEPILAESSPFESPVRTHLPPTTDPSFWPEAQPPSGRESREMFWKNIMGAQFNDVKTGRLARDSLETIFPHQSAGKDPTLLPLAVEKRLRFSTPEKNAQRLARASHLGPAIFERFATQFKLPTEHTFDPELFCRCIAETEARKLEKPLETIWNNIDRSDPDWQLNYMECFVKSQHKAKAETLAYAARWNDSDDIIEAAPLAKAGQTLVTSPDKNIFDLGPVARYLRAIVKQTLPENVYLHGGKTIAEMNSWSKKFATGEQTFSCDFSAYDQSCTEETLSFELAMMSYAGIPSELIDHYQWIKLNMRTQFGASAVMRFTGEFGTYDFNTFWNMAYMTLRYAPDPSLPCCYSGDDSLFFGSLSDHPLWYRLAKYFSLIGKTAYCYIPEFCGWLMYPCGVVRHPIILALKIRYRESRGDLDKILDNYFLEAHFAHQHGDELFKYLPPLALEAQRWVMDFCFKHSSLVPHLRFAVDPSRWSHIPLSLVPAFISKLLNVSQAKLDL
jgi:hypothetical protein